MRRSARKKKINPGLIGNICDHWLTVLFEFSITFSRLVASCECRIAGKALTDALPVAGAVLRP
jgi:hypothetical protein